MLKYAESVMTLICQPPKLINPPVSKTLMVLNTKNKTTACKIHASCDMRNFYFQSKKD